jgi:hypothetical protein
LQSARPGRSPNVKGFAEERLRGRDAPIAAEQEIDSLAVLIDGAIQVDFALIEM